MESVPPRAFCFSSRYCSPADQEAHHVTVANKRSDGASLATPAPQRCTATAKTSNTNRPSASGPRQGRSTIECDRHACAGPSMAGRGIPKGHRSGVSGLPYAPTLTPNKTPLQLADSQFNRGSLPHRQLRKLLCGGFAGFGRSLPHRQLRNGTPSWSTAR